MTTTFLTKYKGYIILIIGLVIYFFALNNYISNLKLKIAVLEKDKIELNFVLDNQNKALESIRIDRDNRLKELEYIKSLPPEIKYKTIYKEIPKIIEKSDNCEDIKEVLNSLKGRKL